MKSDDARGPVGAWARNARLAAGYDTARAATDAANRAGIPLRLQHLQGIESGWDRAGRELLLQLGRLYESDPPVSPASPTVDAALAAAVAQGVSDALEPRLARLERLLERLAGGRADPPRRPPRRQ